MSLAKKAVDSTLKKILNYTAEIIMAIFLLIFISVPLIFAIPMWFQHVLFGVSRPSLSVNPVSWFGLAGAIWITLFLGLVSFSIAYLYILKIKPGSVSENIEEERESAVIEAEMGEEQPEASPEDIEEEEEIPFEDQELEETIDDDDISLDDQEEEPDLDEIDDVLSEEE